MTKPRIVYACFATPRHSGGVHVMMQHVQLLISAGYQACLWLPGGGRPGWFDPDVPVVCGATVEIGAGDVLVLPEVPLAPGVDPAPGARKVVFNQNHFYTFAAGEPATGDSYPGWSPAPTVWAVSSESRSVLGALFPDLDIVLVPNPVDGELFTPRPSARQRISWFPRKRPRESSLLRRLFGADPRLAGVDLCELVDAPRRVVAETLGSTTIFVSLGHSESFGLPVAEALASGCLVVGYDGGGGHELFEAPGAWPIADQRPLLLCDKVAELLEDRDEYSAVRAANRHWVLERYSFPRTVSALTAAIDDALARPGGSAIATHPAGSLDLLGPNFTAYA